MCRLLGVVSPRPLPLTESIGEHLAPFEALSSLHCDGWGIASWGGTDTLQVHKAPEPARTSQRFDEIAEKTMTDAALLHLRKASPGMQLRMENTHPFSDGHYALAHNGFCGTAADLDVIVAEVGGVPAVGTTDSERYFSIVMALLDDLPPAAALLEAARRIGRGANLCALNTLLLTPDALYAMCYYDPAKCENEPGGVEGYFMHYTVSRREVIVASTGWDREIDRWSQLPNGEVLEISRHTLEVNLYSPAENAA